MQNIKPLFPKEKRQARQLRMKKGIYDLAVKIAERLYPFSEKPDVEAFLEQAITITAHDLGLVNEEPVLTLSHFTPLPSTANYPTDDVLNTDGLLGGNAIDAYLDDNI